MPADNAQDAQAEKSEARSAIILAMVLVLVGAYCAKFGLQTLVWAGAKHWASENPWLSETPQPFTVPAPLPAQSAAQTKPAWLKAYEYEFIPPWPGASRTVPEDFYTEFRFDAGPIVVIFDPAAQSPMLEELKKSNPAEYERIQDILPDQPTGQNYALYRAVYGASPDQISPVMRRADASRLYELLLLKLQFGFDSGPGIHALDSGANHAFEFGDPASGRPVAVRVFDRDDKQVRLTFAVAGGSSGQFTQNDVSAVVTSLQPVPILER
jgi:hypothetical protein